MGHLQIDSSFILQLSVQKLNTWLTAVQDLILGFTMFKRNSSCGVKRLIQSFTKLELLKTVYKIIMLELYTVILYNF